MPGQLIIFPEKIDRKKKPKKPKKIVVTRVTGDRIKPRNNLFNLILERTNAAIKMRVEIIKAIKLLLDFHSDQTP